MVWDRDGLGSRLRAGLQYALSEPHVLWPTVLAGMFGLLTSNPAVTLAAFAHSVFHSGPAATAC